MGSSRQEVLHNLSVLLHIQEVQTSPRGGTQPPSSILCGDSCPGLERLDPPLVFDIVQVGLLILLHSHYVRPLGDGDDVGNVLDGGLWLEWYFLTYFPGLGVVDIEETLGTIIENTVKLTGLPFSPRLTLSSKLPRM